jgi:hypothetical protein
MYKDVSRGLFFAAVLIAPSAFAVDGVVLINQNTASSGLPGCSSTGTFPIVICQSGSYRLSGNLTVTAVNTDAIDISTDNVTLDLNGFTIKGPISCSSGATGVSCSPNPLSGTGVAAPTLAGGRSGGYISVVNGNINGFVTGVGLPGFGTLVDGIRVSNFPLWGISVGPGLVNRCTVSLGTAQGIAVGYSTNVTGNSVNLTNGAGISGGGLVSNNTLSSTNITLLNTGGIVGAGLSVNNFVQ